MNHHVAQSKQIVLEYKKHISWYSLAKTNPIPIWPSELMANR